MLHVLQAISDLISAARWSLASVADGEGTGGLGTPQMFCPSPGECRGPWGNWGSAGWALTPLHHPLLAACPLLCPLCSTNAN